MLSPSEFFAKKVYKSIKGLGTDKSYDKALYWYSKAEAHKDSYPGYESFLHTVLSSYAYRSKSTMVLPFLLIPLISATMPFPSPLTDMISPCLMSLL